MTQTEELEKFNKLKQQRKEASKRYYEANKEKLNQHYMDNFKNKYSKDETFMKKRREYYQKRYLEKKTLESNE